MIRRQPTTRTLQYQVFCIFGFEGMPLFIWVEFWDRMVKSLLLWRPFGSLVWRFQTAVRVCGGDICSNLSANWWITSWRFIIQSLLPANILFLTEILFWVDNIGIICSYTMGFFWGGGFRQSWLIVIPVIFYY